MAGEKILIVEDEEDIAELIAYNLGKEGCTTTVVSSGEKAFELARGNVPDLIILDRMLPDLDGLSLCERLKDDPSLSAIPVVMVTARGEESDIVAGLERGADDYIVKPFSPKVLIARVRAVLRRKGAAAVPADGVIRAGLLRIHPERREVLVEGRDVPLTYTEFNILLFLSRRPGWVFTRSQIFNAVRGEHYHVTERSVDVHIRGLRKKLGSEAKRLETVRGVGYRFKE